MKVLVITASFPPMTSGGSDYALRLCQHLAKRGVDVEVITSDIGNLIDTGMRVHPIMDAWSWKELPRLIKTIRAIKPDVINLHFGGFLYNDHPMITFLPTLVKTMSPSMRFVTLLEAPIGVRAYLHSFPVRAFHKIIAEGLRCCNIHYGFGSLLAHSDALIFLSNSHRETALSHDGITAKKSTVIPAPVLMPISEQNGSNPDETRLALGVSPTDTLVAYLGYIYPGKGLETLLNAFSRVKTRLENARLIVIGGTPEIVLKSMGKLDYVEQLHALARELKVEDRIIWTGGFATDSLQPSLYLRASDLCVLPFDLGVHLNNSSFATVASHGVPVVTTRGAALEPPYKHGENALLCPPQDPDAMSAAILSVINDDDLKKRLKSGALDLAKRLFTWDATTNATLEIFKGGHPPDLV